MYGTRSQISGHPRCVYVGGRRKWSWERVQRRALEMPLKICFLNLGGYKCSLCKNPCICTLTIHAVMICMPKLVWVIFQ